MLPHHGHFRPETYYRLLAPSLLPNVEKAIYLDSDLVVCGDLAELFDVDVTGHLLAATRDADTIGQIDGYDPSVASYLKNELGMCEVYDAARGVAAALVTSRRSPYTLVLPSATRGPAVRGDEARRLAGPRWPARAPWHPTWPLALVCTA